MKLAWAASIAAQLLLAGVLWRNQNRDIDMWTGYLLIDAGRSLAIMTFDGTAYYWAWLLTEPLVMVSRFAAAWQQAQTAKHPSWIWTGIAAACSGCLWALLNRTGWPTSRRAPVILSQFSGYLAGGIVLGAWAGGATLQPGVLVYFVAGVVHAILAQFIGSRAAVDTLNLCFMSALAICFSVVAIRDLAIGRRVVHHGQ